jgi:anthranilate synthase/aminodeoxychorismate synthase-like glutamine amidotransferase
MILLIDNYDSFTYNLYQYISELGPKVIVARNDKITTKQILEIGPQSIIISPGPKTPSEAGISEDVIREFHKKIPILGVCLGHQAIGEVFGGKVVKAPVPMHGKTSQILHGGRSIFSSMTNPFSATRYHSLIVSRDALPDRLEVIAWTEDNLVMGVRHKDYPTVGVQFHPESVMTENGKTMLRNFINGII